MEQGLDSLCSPVLSLASYLFTVALLGVVGKGKGQEYELGEGVRTEQLLRDFAGAVVWGGLPTGS